MVRHERTISQQCVKTLEYKCIHTLSSLPTARIAAPPPLQPETVVNMRRLAMNSSHR